MISPSPSCARCVSERPSASSRRLPRRSRRSADACPLLLEIKRGHDNRRLCALTLEALRTYTGPYCVESFDPTIVAWFRRNAPDILRGQLSQPPKEYGTALSKPAAAIVGNVLTNVIARPQFIAYKIGPKPLSVRLCEAMGAVRAGWTSPRLDARARLRHRHLRALPSRRVVPRGHLSAGQACIP